MTLLDVDGRRFFFFIPRVYLGPVKSTLSIMTLCILLAGCPPDSTSAEGSPQKPASACMKEGQNCEYSPGKIGLCAAKADGCDAGLCLSCVSLH